MAFGSTMKAENQTSGDVQKTDWQWLNLKSGVRIFRILPEVDASGKMVVDSSGRGNPVDEISWYEGWWEVNVGGNAGKRRIILGNRFDNPLWKHIQANFEKGSMEYKTVKQKFGINVYDRSLVILNDEGVAVYPDERGAYTILATGKVLPQAVDGTPSPHNKILILEGSAGQIGGKHLLQQFVELAGNIENPETMETARLHELDIRLKTTGKDIKTVRNLFPSSNFKPLDPQIIAQPRWNIKDWAKPWPDEMIVRLIDGEDFNELVTEYGIKLFPDLEVKSVVEPTPTPTIDKTQKPSKQTTKKKLAEDEELFDD